MSMLTGEKPICFKDATKLLYDRLREELQNCSFRGVTYAEGLFQKYNIFIIVYVYDVLIFAITDEDIAEVKDILSNALPTKYLGRADHFLGVDLSFKSDSVTLMQPKVIKALTNYLR